MKENMLLLFRRRKDTESKEERKEYRKESADKGNMFVKQ